MPITKPSVLPAWADTGDKTQPTNSELSAGWPLSSTPPSRQRFNWVLNYLANAVRYFSRRGLPDYDAAETYMTGDRVIGDDGKTYRSLVDNNTAQTPSISPTKWERWALGEGELQQNTYSVAAASGTADALTASFTPAIATLSAGLTLHVRAASANATATPTFTPNVGVIPAKPIVKGANQALVAGDIAGAGHWLTLQYDATLDKWVLLNPAGGTNPTLLFGSSIAANGYQKLPSGLIIQWGQFTHSGSGSGGLGLTFPIAFSNTNYQLVGVENGATPTVGFSCQHTSPSQATVYTNNPTTVYMSWIALGI